ncbi:TPA: hypothetical protein ACGOVV_001540, partial [Streptococcus suis]
SYLLSLFRQEQNENHQLNWWLPRCCSLLILNENISSLGNEVEDRTGVHQGKLTTDNFDFRRVKMSLLTVRAELWQVEVGQTKWKANNQVDVFPSLLDIKSLFLDGEYFKIL